MLTEADAHQVSAEVVTAAGEDSEAAADRDNLRSPETYVGFDRAERFVSPSSAVPDRQQHYVIPDQVALNHWALSGDWNIGGEAAVAPQANGKIVSRFHARDLHLVMRPSPSDSAVRIPVTLDGKPPGSAHGTDVESDGNGTVNRAEMYQLIRQLPPIRDEEIEIEFLDPGVKICAFTFG
ncbi:hypothetical protein [Pseudomonas sp. NPDC096950]|uniref:hypothetical protein n=1 Tax=Pseudomonas sp. NPDC096950 TaxID=3364485 RepID=UPI00383B0B89